ncbi:hypothetical protein ACFWU5_28600 [Nocardia sp. NPDC058640]
MVGFALVVVDVVLVVVDVFDPESSEHPAPNTVNAAITETNRTRFIQ